jgi:hypothetical protein
MNVRCRAGVGNRGEAKPFVIFFAWVAVKFFDEPIRTDAAAFRRGIKNFPKRNLQL